MTTSTILPGYAVVTGAASGIGQGIAKAIVDAGISGIALLDINAAGLKNTKTLLSALSSYRPSPPNILTLTCDVTLVDAVKETYATILETFGRIDYSIHCAGIMVFGYSLDLAIEDFDRQNSLNYRGLWLCQRAALNIMCQQSLSHEAYPEASIPAYRAQRGAIVNISSILALTSQPGTPVYAATKAAVVALTRSDALDYALKQVRINAVMPGLIDTPATNANPEERAMLEAGPLQRAPVKRFGRTEEIADVVVFLCGVGASFVTGAAWAVDGGMLTN